MTIRKLQLMAIDTAIAGVVFWGLGLLSSVAIGSLQVNGAFTIPKLVVFWLCLMVCRSFGHIYGSVWRYADEGGYLRLVIVDVVAGALYMMLCRTVKVLSLGFGYSVLLSLSVLLLTICSRLCYQYLYAYSNRYKDNKQAKKENLHRINIAIVGAGNVGATLAGELLRNPGAH